MPFKQKHRGRHPEDDSLFDPTQRKKLHAAAHDLSWLYSRGYSSAAAQKLVGDRYQLAARQRKALQRVACSDAQLARRAVHFVAPEALAGDHIAIDGYNLLITTESALSGGLLLRGRDGAIRDLASLHGSYRKVEETLPAIRLIGEALAAFAPAQVEWYFDSPISNSGRLRALVLEEAERHGWPWDVELVATPDPILAESGAIVITSDSYILDRAGRWCNFLPAILERVAKEVEVVDFGLGG